MVDVHSLIAEIRALFAIYIQEVKRIFRGKFRPPGGGEQELLV
jgi:hypothetical protein